MTIASNYPSIRPSLLLDFANTKQLDPRITFSRPTTTTATYYDGKTVAKAEENLVLQSEDFLTNWSAGDVTITSNSTTAPNGTSTADTIADTAANSIHRVLSSSVSFNTLLPYTFSVFLKANTIGFAQLLYPDSAFDAQAWANFDLTNGVLGTVGSGATATITSVGNGWYRCSITATTDTTTTGGSSIFVITSATAGRAQSYVGTGQSIYAWGAQLEQRSTVTAYTPTTTAPITNYIPALQTAAANVARFDHDPVTGESKGLLIEEQRTNLLTYSEQFDNAAWSKSNSSITSNTVIAPDGSLTGDKLVASAASAYLSQLYASSATTYTLSVYAKAAKSGDYLGIVIQPTYLDRVGARFDLNTGTVIGASTPGGSTSVVVGSSITAVGNGWYRCALTATVPSGGSARWYFGPSDSTQNNNDPFGSSTLRSIYIWGAQLEAGSFPTSYIPTVASQVTRSADSASMTGSNFSSWYRADEGTVYSQFSGYGVAPGNYPSIVEFSNSSAPLNEFISAALTPSPNIAWIGYSGGQGQWDYVAGAFVANTQFSLSGAYQRNSVASSLNGASVVTDTNATIPSGLNQLKIGSDRVNRSLNGTIKRIAYYPKRLSNTELQSITS